MRCAKQKEIFKLSDLRRMVTFYLRSVCPPGRGVGVTLIFKISDLRRRETLNLMSVCPFVHQGGGGGTLIFSYIRRPRLCFGVQNFEFQYFWVFRKLNILGGMKVLWIFLGGKFQIFIWGA